MAGWILELDRGRGIPFQGNYSSWLEQKTQRLAQEQRTDKARAKTLAAELEWVRENPKGRRKKSKARLARYEALLAEDRNVQARRGPDPHPGRAAPRRRGDRGRRTCARASASELLIEDLSFSLPPAGIVGVIGANGAGKTTLFRMIVGDEQPDAGALELGESVELAYVDQSRDALDAEKTVWEEISDGYDQIKVGDREMNSRAYVSRLQLQGLRPAAQGRARSRAASATASTWRSCCAPAATCCCSTSRPTTSTSTRCGRSRRRCSPSPAARWSSPTTAGSSTGSRPTCSPSRATPRSVWFEGNFEAYEENRRERLGAAADRPHRITYKKLVAR